MQPLRCLIAALALAFIGAAQAAAPAPKAAPPPQAAPNPLLNLKPVPGLGLRLLHHGIFVARDAGMTDAPDMLAGAVGRLDSAQVVEETTTIPAQRGLKFGIQFVITGPVQGQIVPITFVTQYPKPGLTNADGKKAFREQIESFAQVGRPDYYGFTFEEPWEMVCGHWQFEVWSGDQQLAVQDYQVVSPNCPTS